MTQHCSPVKEISYFTLFSGESGRVCILLFFCNVRKVLSLFRSVIGRELSFMSQKMTLSWRQSSMTPKLTLTRLLIHHFSTLGRSGQVGARMSSPGARTPPHPLRSQGQTSPSSGARQKEFSRTDEIKTQCDKLHEENEALRKYLQSLRDGVTPECVPFIPAIMAFCGKRSPTAFPGNDAISSYRNLMFNVQFYGSK